VSALASIGAIEAIASSKLTLIRPLMDIRPKTWVRFGYDQTILRENDFFAQTRKMDWNNFPPPG
jgi:phosphoglycerol transferase MdoB-like AlkP superfamily enzyme